jgi:hypothetical protein
MLEEDLASRALTEQIDFPIASTRGLTRTGLRLTKEALDLGEGFFDGVEVGE